VKESVVLVASWEGVLLDGGHGGRVRLGPQIAHGGFGAVHRGRVEPNGPAVAVKLLVGASDDLRADAFRAEIALLAALRHPHVASIVASGVAPGDPPRPWFAMEWCEGRTLQQELAARRGRRHTRAEAWALLGPIVDAVAHAHAAGCVHRDLKPANVMLVSDAAFPGGVRPMLIDWGIGKRVAPGATAGTGETATMGHLRAYTEAYAAPEQIAGTRTGPWTDVHALALLLTELLVGERPFGSESGVFAVLDPTRPTPKTFGVDAGPWEPVLARAMSFHAAERPASAGELAAALRAADPSLVAPPPVASPAGAAPRVPRAVLYGAAAVGALALGVGGVLAFSGDPPKRSRHEASRESDPAPSPTGTSSAAPHVAAHASSVRPSAAPPPAASSLRRPLSNLEDLSDQMITRRLAILGFTPIGNMEVQRWPPDGPTTITSIARSYSNATADGLQVVRKSYSKQEDLEVMWQSCIEHPDAYTCAAKGHMLLLVMTQKRDHKREARAAILVGITDARTNPIP